MMHFGHGQFCLFVDGGGGFWVRVQGLERKKAHLGFKTGTETLEQTLNPTSSIPNARIGALAVKVDFYTVIMQGTVIGRMK